VEPPGIESGKGAPIAAPFATIGTVDPSPTVPTVDATSANARGSDDSVTIPEAPGDVVEAALAAALGQAAAAQQWAIVAQLGKELEARRPASAGNVVALPAKREGSR